MTDSERLAEIEARVEAAAPEPWRTHRDQFGGLYVRAALSWTHDEAYEDEPDVDGIAMLVGADDSSAIQAEAHAAFIAHARSDIPWLLEREKKLREALAGIMPETPWDVDQDCRYCSGHYDWHETDCPWEVAGQALADSGEASGEAG